MSVTSPTTEAELRSVKVEVIDLQNKLSSMESMMSSIHTLLIAQSQIVSTPSAVSNSPLHEENTQLGDPIKGSSILPQIQQSIGYGPTTAPVHKLELPRLNKFKGRYWESWKVSVVNLLQQAGLSTHILDDTTRPLSTEAHFSVWASRDTVAFGYIYNNMSEEKQCENYASGLTAFQFWTKLLNRYENTSEVSLILLDKEFHQQRQGPAQKLTEYVHAHEKLVSRMRALGITTSERGLVSNLMMGLNTNWDFLITIMLSTTSSSSLSYQQALDSLLVHAAQRGPSVEKHGTGFTTGQSHYTKNQPGVQGRGLNEQCDACGKKGHTPDICRLKVEFDSKGVRIRNCYYCGVSGHLANKCPKRQSMAHHLSNTLEPPPPN